MVAGRLPVDAVVFVNAMVPLPGETAGAWWANTGAVEAREAAAEAGGWGPFDVVRYFLHDVPADLAAEGEQHQHDEAEAVFASVCDFPGWPDVPLRVLAGADDRFFPAGFQQRVAGPPDGAGPPRPGRGLSADRRSPVSDTSGPAPVVGRSPRWPLIMIGTAVVLIIAIVVVLVVSRRSPATLTVTGVVEVEAGASAGIDVDGTLCTGIGPFSDITLGTRVAV